MAQITSDPQKDHLPTTCHQCQHRASTLVTCTLYGENLWHYGLSYKVTNDPATPATTGTSEKGLITMREVLCDVHAWAVEESTQATRDPCLDLKYSGCFYDFGDKLCMGVSLGGCITRINLAALVAISRGEESKVLHVPGMGNMVPLSIIRKLVELEDLTENAASAEERLLAKVASTGKLQGPNPDRTCYRCNSPLNQDGSKPKRCAANCYAKRQESLLNTRVQKKLSPESATAWAARAVATGSRESIDCTGCTLSQIPWTSPAKSNSNESNGAHHIWRDSFVTNTAIASVQIMENAREGEESYTGPGSYICDRFVWAWENGRNKRYSKEMTAHGAILTLGNWCGVNEDRCLCMAMRRSGVGYAGEMGTNISVEAAEKYLGLPSTMAMKCTMITSEALEMVHDRAYKHLDQDARVLSALNYDIQSTIGAQALGLSEPFGWFYAFVSQNAHQILHLGEDWAEGRITGCLALIERYGIRDTAEFMAYCASHICTCYAGDNALACVSPAWESLYLGGLAYVQIMERFIKEKNINTEESDPMTARGALMQTLCRKYSTSWWRAVVEVMCRPSWWCAVMIGQAAGNPCVCGTEECSGGEFDGNCGCVIYDDPLGAEERLLQCLRLASGNKDTLQGVLRSR
ncbi:hypothetical protein ABW20_dc0103364 [Dactylellina cionopaga]|nr:hypothetical protein ABW20_dc0103364 [Dactylellina cionopaga]